MKKKKSTVPVYDQCTVQAAQKRTIRPALFYTEQEQTPCDAGVWESRETVNRKLKQREEFPLG